MLRRHPNLRACSTRMDTRISAEDSTTEPCRPTLLIMSNGSRSSSKPSRTEQTLCTSSPVLWSNIHPDTGFHSNKSVSKEVSTLFEDNETYCESKKKETFSKEF